MAYTQAKTPVTTVKLQVREHPSIPSVKDERTTSKGSWILGLLRGGASMIQTILSVIILLFMSIVFKFINAKQREFDQMEDKRR
jgi:uncharacterized membrane protein